ncbi:papain family cysteine protease (macronuclear) [Tetrahymena thermophila SB210]|uniref:Papain family cysteine protease n=1 Tax=Tetrahymena thermophila (strain SB210) TaxID=312017 RepID=I7M1M9_TETTS|nr:papain family cysteine protease [Tetrahymena thermophila SB210]EAR97208.1 papain family cysteine protease [Tetrahymena thermophila SB210]|eukprot:XP_001017453.1 papain family cysteine protease [Tetrahymena thermophila SB210]
MKFIFGACLSLILTSLIGLGYLIYKDTPQSQFNKIKSEFENFKNRYNLEFNDIQEEQYRLFVFHENFKQIELDNMNSDNGFISGINKFSHLTKEEFKAKYLNRPQRPASEMKTNSILSSQQKTDEKLPESVDWRKLGAVSPVRDQGNCGSCYAFASTGALEGLYQIKTGKLEVFSPQYIVDCAKHQFSRGGCHGGYSSGVFTFVKENGMNLESRYPYKGEENDKCLNQETIKFVNDFKLINQGDCQEIERVLFKQPVSISLDAEKVQHYQSGILKQCSDTININHEVLAVGYTSDYFILKNSWGSDWGIDGYFYVSKNNNCGTCDGASYPTL